ncbi:hypothetical protein ACIQYS_10295 [Psychrobacillus sp. NPDC096426]|uniref:hypothetical protein n=1 Tax=Psychrobacillus sp. NPDC096426 TaxID=3364491 RepID=UPI00382B6832
MHKRIVSEKEYFLLEKLKLDLKEAVKNENKHRISNLEKQINKMKFNLDLFNEEEKVIYIGELMKNAFHVKTDEYQDRRVAENEYEAILRLDKNNPEAAYRFAYLQYNKSNWLKAINYFQKAVETHGHRKANFPLTEDQVIKGKLYIGYCAAQLAKETLNEANGLNEESLDLPVEGISVEQLLDKLKNEIKKTEYTLITKDGQKGISKEEYENLLDNLEEEQLMLSFIEDKPFIQRGEENIVSISGTLSILLKELLLKSKRKLFLSLDEVNEMNEKSIKENSYTKSVSRLNTALGKCGFAKKIITKNLNDLGYKIDPLDFYIIAREDHHL